MGIHMGDAWCRALFDISSNKVQCTSRHEISQRRISSMLRNVAPSAHNERARDLLDRTNQVPYYAPYFGYKLHMDQNEKLAQEFGVTHVHALDGCSRMVLGFIAIPKRTLCLSTNIYFDLFWFSLGYLIRCVLIMAQNSASASLYRSYSRIYVMITAELLGGKQHPPRITGQRGFGQRKTPE